MTIGELIRVLYMIAIFGGLAWVVYKKIAGSSNKDPSTDTASAASLNLTAGHLAATRPAPAPTPGGIAPASVPPVPALPHTKVGRIVGKVVDHLKGQDLSPTTECWDEGNTCNINLVMAGARYRIQIMDPSEYETIAVRFDGAEEITLGTSENVTPTEADHKLVQLCRQVDQGRFN